MHGSRLHSMCAFQTMTLNKMWGGVMRSILTAVFSADVRATRRLATLNCDSCTVALSHLNLTRSLVFQASADMCCCNMMIMV